jgi:hypothetical protein
MKNNNQNLKSLLTQGKPQADRSVTSITNIETEFLELLKREIGIFAFEFLTVINPIKKDDEKKITNHYFARIENIQQSHRNIRTLQELLQVKSIFCCKLVSVN